MGFGQVAEKTRAPAVSLRSEIYDEIFGKKEDEKFIEYSKKILISGYNNTGKSTLALRLLCTDLKDDEVIIYIDADNSGAEVISTVFKKEKDNGQILYWSPHATKKVIRGDREVTIRDEEQIVERVMTAGASIQDAMEAGWNIKGIIVDGVSFLLEYSEAKMRLEKNLSPDQGVSMSAWKIRNKFFRDFYSPYMVMLLPVIFISHDNFIRKPTDERDLSSVKSTFIDECSVRIETYTEANANNSDVEDYYAVIQKDRSNIRNVKSKYVFLSVNRAKYDENKKDNYESCIDECSQDIVDAVFKNPTN